MHRDKPSYRGAPLLKTSIFRMFDPDIYHHINLPDFFNHLESSFKRIWFGLNYTLCHVYLWKDLGMTYQIMYYIGMY